MKRPRIATIAVALLILAPFALWAEGSQEEAEGPTSMNIIIGEWAGDVLEPFFEEYGEENNVTVEYEAYPFRELFETIQIRQEANAEDIDAFFVDAPLVPSYAVRGYMKDISDYFTPSVIDETWADGSGDAGYWDGRFYAPPLNNSTQVMYYNKDLLEEAGIDFPSEDPNDRWTWDEVVEAATAVNELGQGTWGFAFDQINRYYQLQVLPESLGGGSGVTDDGLEVDITNPEWITAHEWYGRLFNEWAISPKGASPAEVPELFSAGNIGFFVGGLWNIPAFNEAGIDYAVAPHPYFEEGEPATPTLSWHVGVWSHTRNEEAAVDFVKYLTMDPEIGQFWLEEHGQFPARKEVLSFIMEDDKYAEQPFIGYRIGRYEVLNSSILRARTPAFLEFEELLSNAYEDIRNGADVESTLSGTEQQLSNMFERYQ